MDANKSLHTITSVINCFSDIEDPRVEGRTTHKLIDILVLTVCAAICGAQTWKSIEAFGYAKEGWLRTLLELPGGIPSDQTISRVFSLIHPDDFQSCFMEWTGWEELKTPEEIVAIDGKTLRRSHNKRLGKKAIHIVNAFATKKGISIGQEKTDEKSNEIKAIPILLKKLDLSGCIVTIDAMGTQKGIANLVRLKGADYVLAVKGNQGKLHKKISCLFNQAEEKQFKSMVFKDKKTVDGEHGRVEERTYTFLPLMYLFEFKKVWKDLQTVVRVESCVYKNGEERKEVRYFISSLAWSKVDKISEAIRCHWHIENRLHWCLDVIFKEDDCRIRRDYADQNFATVRQLVLNMLRRDTNFKAGLEIKRNYAAWNDLYRKQLLGL